MRWALWSGLLLAAACSGDDDASWRSAAGLASESDAALAPQHRFRHFVVGFEDDAAVARAAEFFVQPSPLVDPERALALQQRAGGRSGEVQPELRRLWRAAVPSQWSDAEARSWAEEQRGEPGVRFVVFRGAPPPPPGDIDPATPNHETDQGYLYPDPGIDAVGAAAMGFSGAGVRLSDVEYGWNTAHEELEDIDLHPEDGQTVAAEALRQGFAPEHGTAAIGMVVAAPGGYGITGMAPGVEAHTFPEWTEEGGFRRAEAVASAIAASEVGDVVMLQMQIQDPETGGFGPAELDEDIWLLTRMATDAGVIVVAAAGNGGLDLGELDAYRELGDSGALLVGAGDPELHNTMPFSGSGDRVDLQGWGADVFTLGYGDFAAYGRDPNQGYTATFEGTSSAVPMVAAAAALVTEAARDTLGRSLTPLEMRRLLVATGTAAGEGPHIGPLPNVPAAIEALSTEPSASNPGRAISVQIDAELDGLALQVADPDASAVLDVAVAVEHGAPLYRVQLEVVDAAGHGFERFDETPPFEIEALGLPPGSWVLTATATDVWGAVGASSPVLISVEVETKEDTESSTSLGDGTGAETTTSMEDTDLGSSMMDADAGSPEGGGCRVTGGRDHGAWAWLVPLLWLRRRRTA